MQRRELYIGYPKQQSQVTRALSVDLNKEKSGIYLVTGGIRVGKTSVIKQVEDQFDLRFSIPGIHEDREMIFSEYRDALKLNRSDPTNIIVSTTEISDVNTEMLRALNDIVVSEVKKGNRIRIFGDVVSKRFPAWNSKVINRNIGDTLHRDIQYENFKTYPLDSDPEAIANGVWTMINSEHPSTWGQTVEELGFPPSYSEFWNLLPQTQEGFVQKLTVIMKKNQNGGLEGVSGRQGERL